MSDLLALYLILTVGTAIIGLEGVQSLFEWLGWVLVMQICIGFAFGVTAVFT
jgi:hypothetical protein